MRKDKQSLKFLVMWIALLAYPTAAIIISAFGIDEPDAPGLMWIARNVTVVINGVAKNGCVIKQDDEHCEFFENCISDSNFICGTSNRNHQGWKVTCTRPFTQL